MLMKANSDLVRRQNRRLVLESLRQHGPMARVQLGQVTGLSPASITSISSNMLAEGLISTVDEAAPHRARGGRGRPQTKLALNAAAASVIALAVSADGVSIASADFSGAIRRLAQLDINTFKLKADEFAPLLADHIKAYAAQNGLPLASVARIGVAVQGVADTAKGNIAWSPAFEARDLPVVAPIEELLGIPCTVANNANRIADGLLGENRAKYGGITAVVFLGHGIGLGLILDGKVFEGSTGRASEFGHMNHDPEGPLCRCGIDGCLEAYSADYGILRMARGGDARDNMRVPVSASVMSELQIAAEAGEAKPLAAFERAGEVLGFGVARLIALINPHLVVFTGPGTRAFHLMRKPLEAALARALVHDLYKDVEFEVAAGDRDYIITGTVMEALGYLDREVFAMSGPGTNS